MIHVQVSYSDITYLKVDAVCTRVFPAPQTFEEISLNASVNQQIIQAAGMRYHAKLREHACRYGDEIIIRGSRDTHRGNFDHVVFYAANGTDEMASAYMPWLYAADRAGMRSIAIPILAYKPMFPTGFPDKDQEYTRTEVLQQVIYAKRAIVDHEDFWYNLITVWLCFDPELISMADEISQYYMLA